MDTALVQWCCCLATMILVAEKVLAACALYEILAARRPAIRSGNARPRG
jgi:hypothetical protein